MGVKGLLPCLQSITRSVSLERYRGLAVAVDAMSWLHKGVFACDVKALANSQRDVFKSSSSSSTASSPAPHIKCINYTMKMAENLRSNFGMDVMLVIDGDALPCKKEENEKRRADRDEAFKKAIAAEQSGDSRAARRFYAQSCSVTHHIRYELIKACKQAGIPFLVAPYEADAQMARMAHTGIVDLVITEDSDTLVYGCPRVLFKIDFNANQGQEIQLMRDLGKNKSPSFRNWTHDMFVFMCILSGCDYCDGIQGIGIKLAHKVVRIHRTPSKIFNALRVAGRMTRDFEEKFWIAFRTFRHQRVYCPSKQQIETLWPIVGSNHNANPNEIWPFLGGHIDPLIASGIANGTLHPVSKTEWSSALRQLHNTGHRHLNSRNIVAIHHRKPKRNEARHKQRSNSDGKENIWHSLVYGSNGHHDVPEGGNDTNQAKQTEVPSRNDMFSFFPTRDEERDCGRKKKRSRDNNKDDDDARPPLTEIYLGGLSSGCSSSKNKSKYVPPASHKDVPIHFHEYSSRLVGKSFKPMSRKRRKEANYGSKSSRCVQKIWEKSKAHPNRALETNAPILVAPDNNDRGEAEAKEDQGLSMFQKVKTTVEDELYLNTTNQVLESESYREDDILGHHQEHPFSFRDDGYHMMMQPQYSDNFGHSSSSTNQYHQSSSLFDYDKDQPQYSDISLTGAYTTVTAEPQEVQPKEGYHLWDTAFTTSEQDRWEDPTFTSNEYTMEPTSFDSSFCPNLEFGYEHNANGKVYQEDNMFYNIHVPDSYENCENHCQIDNCLMEELNILQQM